MYGIRLAAPLDRLSLLRPNIVDDLRAAGHDLGSAPTDNAENLSVRPHRGSRRNRQEVRFRMLLGRVPP